MPRHYPLARRPRLPHPRNAPGARRRLVTHDPEAPAELVERLSRDEDDGVREAAAADPRLPLARLLEMLDDPETATSAARNRALPVEAMAAIVDARLGPSCRPRF